MSFHAADVNRWSHLLANLNDEAGDEHVEEGDQGVLMEMDTANGLFRERLGYVPVHFAYPSGSRNAWTDGLLAPRFRSLRLWHKDWPIVWTITDPATSRLGIECQNIDACALWRFSAQLQ